jgi:hypothetical protein
MAYKNPEDQLTHQREYRRAGPGKATLRKYDQSAKGKANRAKANRTLRHRYCLLRSRAKRKGLETLTFEDYCVAVEGEPCLFCNVALTNVAGVGLDRLDHKHGYNRNNVVPCCKSCNIKKGFLEAAGFVYPRTVVLLEELLCTS